MCEAAIEKAFVEAVRKSSGLALKFVSPGMNGMPDRLVLMPGGKIAFVEVKAPGQKARKLQKRRHARLRTLGFAVYVLDRADDIPAMVQEIGGGDDGCTSD